MGYDESPKGYRIWFLHKQTVVKSCNASFDEMRFYQTNPSNLNFDVEHLLTAPIMTPHELEPLVIAANSSLEATQAKESEAVADISNNIQDALSSPITVQPVHTPDN